MHERNIAQTLYGFLMKTKQKKRNGHACHAIMRKGGAHIETNSMKRQKDRQQTRKQMMAWRDHAPSSLLAA